MKKVWQNCALFWVVFPFMKILTMFLFWSVFIYVFSMALMLGCPKIKNIHTYNMENSVSKQQTIRLKMKIKIIWKTQWLICEYIISEIIHEKHAKELPHSDFIFKTIRTFELLIFWLPSHLSTLLYPNCRFGLRSTPSIHASWASWFEHDFSMLLCQAFRGPNHRYVGVSRMFPPWHARKALVKWSVLRTSCIQTVAWMQISGKSINTHFFIF